MYVCMYVFMYSCLYICMYVCIYVCMYACICVYMYVCVCTYVRACVRAYVCVCVYIICRNALRMQKRFSVHLNFSKFPGEACPRIPKRLRQSHTIMCPLPPIPPPSSPATQHCFSVPVHRSFPRHQIWLAITGSVLLVSHSPLTSWCSQRYNANLRETVVHV